MPMAVTPRLAAVAALLAGLIATTAAAQVPSPAGPAPVEPAEPTASESPAVTQAVPTVGPTSSITAPPPPSADLQALIATLENDQARAELLAKLKALEAASTPAVAEDDYLSEALDSLNAEVGARMDLLGQALVGLTSSLQEVPVLLRWLWSQLTEPLSRAMWYSIGSQIGAAVAGGLPRQPCRAMGSARVARSPGRAAPGGQAQGARSRRRSPISRSTFWPCSPSSRSPTSCCDTR